MPGKITIVLGAVAEDSVLALIVTQGLGPAAPSVFVRPAAAGSSAMTQLIVKRLEPGTTIAPYLEARGVNVFRVRAPVSGEVVLEVYSPDKNICRKSSPIRALPARLADAPGGLTFALGTCTYYWPELLKVLGTRLRSRYGAGSAPAFAVWAGDNVYLDVPKPAKQGASDVVDRYLQYFLDDGYCAARASLPAFTTYDDHEFWNDYPELALPVDTWLSARESAGFAAAASQCLDLFQRSINPAPSGQAKYTYRVDVPPLSICVLDTRSERTRADAQTPRLLPEADLRELEAWASQLKGPGVLVIGQPLWSAATNKVLTATGDHNVPYFKADYERICKAVEEAPYDIMVCSGDVHYSRLLAITTAKRRVFYELVASPVISIPSNWASFNQLVFGGTGCAPEYDHSIEDPTRVPRAGWHARYEMGTGSGTTFALITVKPAGAQVSVGVSFIDLRTGAAAALVGETKLGPAQHYTLSPNGTKVCSHAAVMNLGRRLV